MFEFGLSNIKLLDMFINKNSFVYYLFNIWILNIFCVLNFLYYVLKGGMI